MSYSRLLVKFCEPCTHNSVLIILGSEPFAVSCKSTPDSVIESIRQGAERIRLGQRLTDAITDMVVRDPAAYSVQGETARPNANPQDYVLKDVINMAIGFAVNETMPKIDSLSWSIQSEQGSLPVCVFSMYLILNDEPMQKGHGQGAMSALHLLAQAAEASDAAAAAGGRTHRANRRKGHAASRNKVDAAEQGDRALRAVIPRAGGSRQRKQGVSKQAEPIKSAVPAGKGLKRAATTGSKPVGGKKIDAKSQPGKRTLSLEQLPHSPSPAAPAQAKARKVSDGKKAPADTTAGATASPVSKKFAQVIQSYGKPKPAASIKAGPSNVQNMDAQEGPGLNATPERMRTRRDKPNTNTAPALSEDAMSPQVKQLRSMTDALAGGEHTGGAIEEDSPARQTRGGVKRSRPDEKPASKSAKAEIGTMKSSQAPASSPLQARAQEDDDVEVVAEVKGSGGRSQQQPSTPCYAIEPRTASRAAGSSAAPASQQAPKASPSRPRVSDTATTRGHKSTERAAIIPRLGASALPPLPGLGPGSAGAPRPEPPVKPPRYRWLQEVADSKPRKSLLGATDNIRKVCKTCKKSLPQAEFRVGQQKNLRATCSACRAVGKTKSKPTLAPAGKKLCTVCNQHKPLEDFRSASGKPNEYCKVCMHYVNQLSYKSSASKSKYKIDDIREAYKEGTLDSLFVPFGKKRCSNCTAVLPEEQFSEVDDSGQTRTMVKMLMNLCNQCRDTRNDAKLHTNSPRKTATHAPRSRGNSFFGGMAGDNTTSLLAMKAVDAARATQDADATRGRAQNSARADLAFVVTANAPKAYADAGAANSGEGSDTIAHTAHAARLRGSNAKATSAGLAGQQPQTAEPSVHAENAAPPDDDGRGSAMDSAVDAMFTEGLGDAEVNAAEAAAAVAASGSRKPAGTAMPEACAVANGASHDAAGAGDGNAGGNRTLGSPDEQPCVSFARSAATGNGAAGGTASAFPWDDSRAESAGVQEISPAQVLPESAPSKKHNKQAASKPDAFNAHSGVPAVPVMPDQVQVLQNPFTDSTQPSPHTLSTLKGSWRGSTSADGIKQAFQKDGNCESVVPHHAPVASGSLPALNPQEDAPPGTLNQPSIYRPQVQLYMFAGTSFSADAGAAPSEPPK